MITRREFLRTSVGATLGFWLLGSANWAQAQPIRVGHQLDRTGAVALFGKWHNRALEAAIKLVNERGGINGRPVELVNSDDAQTKPDVGKDEFEKLVTQKRVDFVIGSVFSGTNIATAPLAKSLKTVYFPQGIATDITEKFGNRYVFKSYHTVRAAIESAHEWVFGNLGKRFTIVHSVIDFGRSQAEDWAAKIRAAGGEAQIISVPFPAPADLFSIIQKIDLSKTDVLYHAFTAVETARFLQAAFDQNLQARVKVLGLIEGIDILSTAEPWLEGTYFISGYPRRADQVPEELRDFDREYRRRVGISAEGFALDNPREVVPIADLFGSWQAIFLLKQAAELVNWRSKAENPALIKALEGLTMPASVGFPQGAQFVRAQDHLVFHDHYIERVENGQLKVLERIPREKSLYKTSVDYTKEEF
ncbi:MAG: ABC transporter substrate-binding protein [Candidatus Bipolaricaulota bacterium]|nr:ABC transporter substrate-binding protein [Candidatus Bipolaricaulota bacterium]MDW8030348.1 ABC transporter substrate-binding protein [Candidatus Bipolaricaulota bacterium]